MCGLFGYWDVEGLPYTQLRAEQGRDLQLHHWVFAPSVAVGDPDTLQHGLHVVVISLLSGGYKW